LRDGQLILSFPPTRYEGLGLVCVHNTPCLSSFVHKGLGRIAMLACILGILLGIHALAMLEIILHQCRMLESSQTEADLLGPDRMQLLLQWCMYAVAVCTFHLMEFFVTAVSNPTMTTSNAFLINHSIAYTAAALVSMRQTKW
jgi:hypothetical protein